MGHGCGQPDAIAGKDRFLLRWLCAILSLASQRIPNDASTSQSCRLWELRPTSSRLIICTSMLNKALRSILFHHETKAGHQSDEFVLRTLTLGNAGLLLKASDGRHD